MVIENILKEEILGINRGLIKKKVSLKSLLKEPVIRDSAIELKVEEEKLKEIARIASLPLDSIFFPITFFIPSGSYEGYVMDWKDAKLLEDMGFELHKRDGKYWIPKYQIRKLVSQYRGLFQSVILP